MLTGICLLKRVLKIKSVTLKISILVIFELGDIEIEPVNVLTKRGRLSSQFSELNNCKAFSAGTNPE